jgi:AraC family transcriptional regulator of adaptative response / DNA-3-methyladenine glycosylase II
MELDFDTCYRALVSRDARFDGRFFATVRTTGIYCRPVCPAPKPRRRNVDFVASAAAAEARGFRACRRCRPECAPGSPECCGSSALLQRALRRLHAGALNEGSVTELAADVGLSARHLTRLFRQELGATPLEVAQTLRAHDARRLLEGTDMKLCDVAFAAGFGSVRSFNGELRARFGRTPGELRRLAGGGRPAAPGELSLRLTYRPPFSWRAALDYLGARAVRGVEFIDGDRYRRNVVLEDQPGWIEVAPAADAHGLRLTTNLAATRGLLAGIERVRALFDLRCDPLRVAGDLSRDGELAALIARHPGLRVYGGWDGFELAVRAVLGQQVSLAGARTLLGRLVEQCGTRLACEAEGLTHAFPCAAAVAEAELEGLGLPRSRATALRALAQAVRAGELDLEPGADPERARAGLLTLPGIGAWTAEYILMRALRDPDAFPDADLVLRKALARDGTLPSAGAVRRRSEAWRPWRAYAAMWLWKSTTERRDDETLPDPRESARRAVSVRE